MANCSVCNIHLLELERPTGLCSNHILRGHMDGTKYVQDIELSGGDALSNNFVTVVIPSRAYLDYVLVYEGVTGHA